jgi:hypothetical protein
MLIAALLLSFSTDTLNICDRNPTNACYVPVEQCMKKNQAQGLEPDLYFHICADEAEYNNWYLIRS